MKVWYDACTGKHVRYAVAIAKKLRVHGHQTLLTTRTHPDTQALADYLNEKFMTVGKYAPSSLAGRLKESLRRQTRLCSIIENWHADYAVSHQSVELARVAFGLGIPTVCTADSPHASAVNRLTLPLADTVVASEAIPKNLLQSFGVRKLVQFKGVDEVAWIRDFKPSSIYLGAERTNKPLIVVRQMETRASYASAKMDITAGIALKLAEVGQVVFLSRYKKLKRKEMVVPEKFVDSASLAAAADLVVSAGGTIAREAALLGTPSIVVSVFEGLYVNDYLSRLGFPLVRVEAEKTLDVASKMLGKKRDVKGLLARLENPVDIVTNVLEKNRTS